MSCEHIGIFSRKSQVYMANQNPNAIAVGVGVVRCVSVCVCVCVSFGLVSKTHSTFLFGSIRHEANGSKASIKNTI